MNVGDLRNVGDFVLLVLEGVGTSLVGFVCVCEYCPGLSLRELESLVYTVYDFRQL